MTTTTSDYLARLDEALRDVPHDLAAEIRSGIAEELSSLDPDAADQRIRQLGDPRHIAYEALQAGGFSAAQAAAPAPAAPSGVPTTSTRGFAIAAALTLSFGGFLLPVVGWVIGAVLVALSAMWRSWEKLVAILVPLVLGGLSVMVGMSMSFSEGASSGSSSGTGTPPEVVSNPLVPQWYDFIFLTAAVLGLLLIPASGLWLLWRMRGRRRVKTRPRVASIRRAPGSR